MAGATIGKDVETGEPVVIEDEDRQRGLYIIGTTGTGKTTLLESLVLQDIDADQGVCVLDPHGDLVNRILEQLPARRAEDVVLLDPRDAAFPFGINPYWCEDPGDSELVGRQAAHVTELFEKLWGSEGSEGTSWGPRVAQFIRNTAFTLLESPGLTMEEIPELLSDAEFRAQVISKVRNPQVRMFWENYNRLRSPERQLERADSTLNKLDEFLTQPIVANIVGQDEPTVDFRRFMDEGKIVLVPLGLGRLGDPVVSLLGSMMTLQILNAALSREDQPVRRQFNLYADEYQRFATPAFATLLTEARKYGVATTIAHQIRGQLDPHTRAAALNAGSIVVFAVHGEDGEELAKQFDRTPPEPTLASPRPKRTISQSPVSHLARNGHQDQAVRGLVGIWLGDLHAHATSLTEGRLWASHPNPDWTRYFADEGGYFASRGTLTAGSRLIDKYLVDWMEDRIDLGTWRDAILEILITLRAFFGIATNEHSPFLGPTRMYQRGENHTVLEIPWDPIMGSEALKAMILCSIAGNFEATGPATRFGERRLIFWDAHTDSFMGWKGETRKPEVLAARAAYEVAQAQNAIRDLLVLGTKLKDTPILVDSGQWETPLERPRAFSDVREEIANNLVKQPQFNATCRVTRDGKVFQHRIETPKFEILDEAHKFTDVDSIRSRSRQDYARPRALVEAERAARRARLHAGGTSRTVDLGTDDKDRLGKE